ncbi:MAG: DUF4395 domain-containing protein [Euryarchaeota archaeon]|nr:DUF4395 domain-containing protein [Euryarchaeota archaeon]
MPDTDAPRTPGKIDPRVPRFNQGVTALLLVVAFVADLPLLVPVVGVVLGAGAFFGPKANLWGQLFTKGVRPLFRLGAPKKLKDPAPPRFAMTLGFVFLAAATAALYLLSGALGLWLGWGLALAVAALAGLAAATDICVGCEVYVLLLRLKKAAPQEA